MRRGCAAPGRRGRHQSAMPCAVASPTTSATIEVAPDLVRQAGDGDVADAGAGGEAGFDFQRMHVAPAADQHVVGAAGYGQPSICIDFPEVAGGQPAVGIDAAAVEVAGHDLRAADADAAVGGRARKFVVAERPADQSFMPRPVGRRPGGDLGGGLAHPVARVERPAGGCRPVVQRLRQRGAADQHVAQAGRRRDAGFEQAGQHGRHQRQMGDRLVRQVGGHRFGVRNRRAAARRPRRARSAREWRGRRCDAAAGSPARDRRAPAADGGWRRPPRRRGWRRST